MKYLKKLSLNILYTIILFITLSLLLTAFNYFNIINYQTLAICKIIIPILSLFFAGLLMGKKATKNGWLEGLKISLIIIAIMTIFTLITQSFTPKILTFFLILILSGIFGSIIGIINIKPRPKKRDFFNLNIFSKTHLYIPKIYLP